MENESNGKKFSGVSYVTAFASVALAFGLGVFVGLHPLWVPIKGMPINGSTDTPDATESEMNRVVSTTYPAATQPIGISQTQPAVQSK